MSGLEVSVSVKAHWRKSGVSAPPVQGEAAANPDGLMTEDNEVFATEDTGEPVVLEGIS